MAFTQDVMVRFNEVDRAGIAFFGRVFEYCHIAYEELFAAAGFPIDVMFEGADGWAMPLVHAEANYVRPMRLGAKLTIQAEVVRLGKSSVGFEYTVRDVAGKTCAVVNLVHCCVNLETFSKHPVPDELRRALFSLGIVRDGACST